MRYFPLTDEDREQIKKEIGIKDIKELFSDISESKSYFPLNEIPYAQAENELIKDFKKITQKNNFCSFTSFLGAGTYNHFIPEVVNYLSSRSEFVTPYTPYQPEVSQGSLQALFEYQTMLCMLTGLDVSNCSLYDGGTAAAEALLLALRFSKNKKKFLVASNIHPEYKEIIETYIQNLEYEIEYIDYSSEDGKISIEDLKEKTKEDIAGFLFQSPNFFGIVEDSSKISQIIHSIKKASSIQIVTEALSLPMLISPGECDVDIVAGEAQSFGLSQWFGGPFLGFMSTKKEYLRQLPGRIIGQTKDRNEKRGYVLTLSTREQHIRREKATSNICTNQAWCALRASIYLSTMGPEGLTKISLINHQNTVYFVEKLAQINNVELKFKKDFFNEVIITIKNKKVEDFLEELKERKILAGLNLGNYFKELADSLLVNFTENHSKEDIDNLLEAMGEIND